jgi:hypothetical protein
MNSLQTLKSSVLEDGRIDDEEVKQIEKVIYQDGKIDEEEADFLFALNDACTNEENPNWQHLFIKAISSYLLDDTNSPGIVDDNECKWLLSKINNDGKVSGLELKLLEQIKKEAKQVPASLVAFIEKNK